MSEDPNALVDSELSKALAASGEMVTKWVAVVEVIDETGERWLRVMNSHGACTWDRMGMLGYAMAEEQAIAADGQG